MVARDSEPSTGGVRRAVAVVPPMMSSSLDDVARSFQLLELSLKQDRHCFAQRPCGAISSDEPASPLGVVAHLTLYQWKIDPRSGQKNPLMLSFQELCYWCSTGSCPSSWVVSYAASVQQPKGLHLLKPKDRHPTWAADLPHFSPAGRQSQGGGHRQEQLASTSAKSWRALAKHSLSLRLAAADADLDLAEDEEALIYAKYHAGELQLVVRNARMTRPANQRTAQVEMMPPPEVVAMKVVEAAPTRKVHPNLHRTMCRQVLVVPLLQQVAVTPAPSIRKPTAGLDVPPVDKKVVLAKHAGLATHAGMCQVAVSD